MWRLNVSSEAELEIFEAALRYERERERLGFRFKAQVNTVFARLLDNPFQFPVIEQDVRRALVRDFPYAVFFTTDADLITLAVLHLRRHPDTWKRTRRNTE
jgi:toxin ParE1/3/4